jgi:protein-disulfide isomerase
MGFLHLVGNRARRAWSPLMEILYRRSAPCVAAVRQQSSRRAIMVHPGGACAAFHFSGATMKRVDEIGSDEHVRGAQEAALTLIEYGDFQCPYCARAHAALGELTEELGGIRLVYRHLPLEDRHPLAELAAEAAEAAASQGKFWEMHDLLFEQQRQVMDKQDLAVLAESLDLDIERFRAEVLGRQHRPRVQGDLARARHDGATGTPTFYINGVRYRGDSDRASLEAALREAMGR